MLGAYMVPEQMISCRSYASRNAYVSPVLQQHLFGDNHWTCSRVSLKIRRSHIKDWINRNSSKDLESIH